MNSSAAALGRAAVDKPLANALRFLGCYLLRMLAGKAVRREVDSEGGMRNRKNCMVLSPV